MKRDLKIADSMADLIGDIPLVRLNRVGKGTGAEILVKPEFLNPSGSIKDRIAKLMIEQAEQDVQGQKDEASGQEEKDSTQPDSNQRKEPKG